MTDQEVLLFDEEAWTLQIISADSVQRPVTLRDTLKCVSVYIRKGKGPMMCRLISLLKRAFTCSLKPRQVSPSA